MKNKILYLLTCLRMRGHEFCSYGHKLRIFYLLTYNLYQKDFYLKFFLRKRD